MNSKVSMSEGSVMCLNRFLSIVGENERSASAFVGRDSTPVANSSSASSWRASMLRSLALLVAVVACDGQLAAAQHVRVFSASDGEGSGNGGGRVLTDDFVIVAVHPSAAPADGNDGGGGGDIIIFDIVDSEWAERSDEQKRISLQIFTAKPNSENGETRASEYPWQVSLVYASMLFVSECHVPGDYEVFVDDGQTVQVGLLEVGEAILRSETGRTIPGDGAVIFITDSIEAGDTAVVDGLLWLQDGEVIPFRITLH